MENDTQKIILPCIGCSGNEHLFFTEKKGYQIYRCKKCNLLFLYPQKNNPIEVYGADYFAGAKEGFGYVDYDRDKEPMRKTFEKYLSQIERLLSKKGKLLDVGAATGFFIDMAKSRGWEVSGVEVSEYAAAEARKKELNVETGTLSAYSAPEGSFDVITLLDVVEHFSDPIEEMKKAYKLLRQGGVLFVNTPDAGSLYAKVLGSKWHLIVPPEHIFLFSTKALVYFLERQGFEVVIVKKIGKRFTLQYILQTLARWQDKKAFRILATKIQKTGLGKISLPLNFRDNVCVIARKV